MSSAVVDRKAPPRRTIEGALLRCEAEPANAPLVVRLEWPEVRFEQDVIEIKAAKAKTGESAVGPDSAGAAAVARAVSSEEWKGPCEGAGMSSLKPLNSEKPFSAIRDQNEEPLNQGCAQWSSPLLHHVSTGLDQECGRSRLGSRQQSAHDFRALSGTGDCQRSGEMVRVAPHGQPQEGNLRVDWEVA
jgi:hypothetical protein